MQILHNLIEDEIYSVDVGQKMAPQLIKEINFNGFIVLFLAFLWKTCKDLENKTSDGRIFSDFLLSMSLIY